MAGFANEAKERSYALMQVRQGHRVLDVGCGCGMDTIPLGRLVGSKGRVFGVDQDETMIAKANARAEEEGMQVWVRHKRADAASLPFESGYFHSSRSERMFEYLDHPESALAEMMRVTIPEGWIVISDIDWGTFSVDTPEVDIERRLARVRAERINVNGYSGRILYRLFKKHELTDISVELCSEMFPTLAIFRKIANLETVEAEAVSAGIITKDELARWCASLKDAEAAGTFYVSGSLVTVAARNKK